jgi:hypothetical protein
VIRTLVLLIAALPGLARADARPDRAALLLTSIHVGATQDFEEINPGLFLQWDGSPLDWTLGAYHNSYGDSSVAAFASLPVRRWEGGEAAIFLGLARYPGVAETFRVHLGEWVPLGGLYLRQGPAFVQLMPSDGVAADAVIAAGLTFDLPRR